MQSGYSRDKSDPDGLVREAAKERPGKPIRLRLQPGVFRLKTKSGASGQYVAWPNLSWTVECEDIQEVLALREALRVFFEVVPERGPSAVITALKTLAKGEAA